MASLLILVSILAPTAIAFAYNVDGDVTYFYAYRWEEYMAYGINVRCKADLEKISGADPNYVKFRYRFEIRALKGSVPEEAEIFVKDGKGYYFVEMWDILGWQGDKVYDFWGNWLPEDLFEWEFCEYVDVDIYVSSNYDEEPTGDWICGDAVLVSDFPP